MTRFRSRREVAAVLVLSVTSAATFAACAGDESPGGDIAPASSAPAVPSESLALTLADIGHDAYRVDSQSTPVGRISGTVQYDGVLPPDTLVRPTHDLSICTATADAPLIGSRDGVGDAVVWLLGVTHGAADESPRRVQLSLEDCVLQPRVQRVPVGATLLVRSADAMDARLRFLDVSPDVDRTVPASDSAPVRTEPVPRALVSLGDAGAVVPVSSVFETPGLVEVRDDRHPWVRGWIAVAPHPYVTVSDASGAFTFDRVPPGSYLVITWHERLGRVATPVVVDKGIDTRLRVLLPKQ